MMMDGNEFLPQPVVLTSAAEEVMVTAVDASQPIRNDETASSPLVVVDLGSGDEHEESLSAATNSIVTPRKEEKDDECIAASMDEKFLKLQKLMAELDTLKLEQETFRSEQQQ